VDWVAEAAFLPIIMHNPLISQVHAVRTKAWRKKPFSRETLDQLRRLRAQLRERKYDIVFDLQGNFKSGLIDWICGAPERVGFSGDAVQERINLLFTNRRVNFRPADQHVTDRYLRIVSAPFGRDYTGMELSGDIVSSSSDEEAADRFMAELPPGPLFLFQVGTTWKTKYWYAAGWCQLAQKILARYPDATILINWGNADEKRLGEEIAAQAGPGVRLLPWLRISELIPVIRRVHLLIGGDTGPLYLAAAVGTPTVSYYRATSAATYAPGGKRHRSIQAAMECAGCCRTDCDRDAECRASIAVDALFDAAVDLIGQTHPERKQHVDQS
jgi:heptosyltransferase-1